MKFIAVLLYVVAIIIAGYFWGGVPIALVSVGWIAGLLWARDISWERGWNAGWEAARGDLKRALGFAKKGQGK